MDSTVGLRWNRYNALVVPIFLLIVEKMNRKQIELVVKPASYNRMVVNINKK